MAARHSENRQSPPGGIDDPEKLTEEQVRELLRQRHSPQRQKTSAERPGFLALQRTAVRYAGYGLRPLDLWVSKDCPTVSFRITLPLTLMASLAYGSGD
jgi:hypothetical protein